MALNYLLLFVPLIFNTTLKIGFGALCLFAVQLTLQTFEIENFYLFCYPVKRIPEKILTKVSEEGMRGELILTSSNCDRKQGTMQEILMRKQTKLFHY